MRKIGILKKEVEDGIMRSIPSYYEEKKRLREEAELKQAEELKALFENAIEFYNEHYPKSFQKHPIKWEMPKRKFMLIRKNTLSEDLKGLSTEHKLLARYILLYSIKERNYKRVDTFHKFNELRGQLKKLIPGGDLLDKIEKIETEQQKKNNELSDLKRKYAEEVAKANINSTKNQVKEAPKFPCEMCGKECNSPAGLKSHMRTHEPKEDSLDQHNADLSLT